MVEDGGVGFRWVGRNTCEDPYHVVGECSLHKEKQEALSCATVEKLEGCDRGAFAIMRSRNESHSDTKE